MSIFGLGADKLTVRRNTADFYSIFYVNDETGGAVTLSGLTISNGLSDDKGGGIFLFNGLLNVVNSAITGNEAPLGGGGICSEGVLNLINSTVSGNVSSSAGGGILHPSARSGSSTQPSAATAARPLAAFTRLPLPF